MKSNIAIIEAELKRLERELADDLAALPRTGHEAGGIYRVDKPFKSHASKRVVQ